MSKIRNSNRQTYNSTVRLPRSCSSWVVPQNRKKSMIFLLVALQA